MPTLPVFCCRSSWINFNDRDLPVPSYLLVKINKYDMDIENYRDCIYPLTVEAMNSR